MENENDKRKARRRRRNSKAPDPFRRAFETDSTLRKSIAGEAPSSRRGSSAVGTGGAPSSRRGSAAAARRSHEVTDAGAARALAESLDFDAAPASEQRRAKASERRPKLAGTDGAAVITEVSPAPLSEAPRSGVEAPSRTIDPSKAKRIGIMIAVAGVVIAGLLGWAARGPSKKNAAGPASGESPAGQVETTPPTPPAVPTAVAEAPTPSPSAAATQAQPPEATDEPQSPADKKKKKKKKTGAKVEATAKTAAPKTTAAPTTTPPPPAFQFQFD
jgi:hypothetical protein